MRGKATILPQLWISDVLTEHPQGAARGDFLQAPSAQTWLPGAHSITGSAEGRERGKTARGGLWGWNVPMDPRNAKAQGQSKHCLCASSHTFPGQPAPAQVEGGKGQVPTVTKQ